MAGTSNQATRIETDPDLLVRILEPYKPLCKYMKKGAVEVAGAVPAPEAGEQEPPHLVRAYGEFSVPESWYIQDTGHFNAVEFNICYNQLFYYTLAACVQHELLDAVADWDLDEYSRRQLPDVLIASLSCTFRKPMKAGSFVGQLDIENVRQKRSTLLMNTTVRFGLEDMRWCSDGQVLIAIVDSAAAARIQ